MANRYGTQKNENEQIFLVHFCWKHAMGAKKRKCSIFFLVGLCFIVVTYGNEVISVCGHKKHRPTELFTPFEAPYKTCL